ncbi:MAG: hypothetical protein ACREJC_05795, partial [Tepidisphaeraceae bacterium]
SFIGSDDTTHGDWIGSYGGGAYFLASGSYWNPDSFVDFNVIDQIDQLWDQDSDDLGALVDPESNSETRAAAAWTSTSSFVLELNFNDNQTHRVSLYFQDYGDKGRMQKIEFYDPASGNMLSQHAITDFSRGKFMTWEVSGHVKVKITRVAGPNAVVSGVFVDAVPAE